MRTLSYFLLLFVTLLSCGEVDYYNENALIIDQVTLVDPIYGSTKNKTVVVENGKILKIIPSTQITLDSRNQIIDGRGKYLIPGLWDTHVHFAYLEALAPSMFDLFLRHGITSVRDTGGKVAFVKQWKDSAKANPSKAPRVMMAGPLLDGTPNVYNGSSPRLPELSVGMTTVADVENEVAALLAADVDLFKAYEMLLPEQFLKIMELAKANGLKVTGHIPLSMDAKSVSEAGLNSIEHLRNLDLSCASNAEELLKERRALLNLGSTMTGNDLRNRVWKAQQEIAIANYDETRADDVLATFKKNNTWQVPTLALNTLFTQQYFAEQEYQKSYALLPSPIKTYWTERSNALKNYPVSKFRKKYDAWQTMMVGKIKAADIPIMAGTDTPIAYLVPGLSLHVELEALVHAGLSNLEALQTATLNPAIYFDLEEQLGRLEEGYWADLVLLTDNPLNDITNTKKIAAVIKQGVVYDAKQTNP